MRLQVALLLFALCVYNNAVPSTLISVQNMYAPNGAPLNRYYVMLSAKWYKSGIISLLSVP